MSYSFNVRAASKALALVAVAAELAKVVAAQPVHAADVDAATATVEAFVGLMNEVEGLELSVSVNGSVSTFEGDLRAASVGVNVYLVAPTPS